MRNFPASCRVQVLSVVVHLTLEISLEVLSVVHLTLRLYLYGIPEVVSLDYVHKSNFVFLYSFLYLKMARASRNT